MQLGHPPTPHPPGSFGWRETLIALHEVVRASVLASSREAAGRRNAKGDSVTTFDLAADRAAIESLAQGPLPLIIDSEESGRQHIGQGSARYRLVLDPVDGSDNWACGLPLSAVSCAILAPDAPLHPDAVEWALVGPLEQEVPCLAERTGGAWCGAARLATSGIGSLADAMISVELNHFAPPRHVTRLMAAARGVRSYGSASRALLLVATGATDAHIDLRGRLTAESYLAGARVLIEAGGSVTAPDGGPLPAPRDLSEGISLIAAASQPLCQEIVEYLRDDAI